MQITAHEVIHRPYVFDAIGLRVCVSSIKAESWIRTLPNSNLIAEVPSFNCDRVPLAINAKDTELRQPPPLLREAYRSVRQVGY